MKRARQLSILNEGLRTVHNLCSDYHFREVMLHKKDQEEALEYVLGEVKLAVEFSLMQYDQEKEKGL